MNLRNSVYLLPFSMVLCLPLAAQPVTMGVRWTDNQGTYEIQNPSTQTIHKIRVTYQQLGKTAISSRQNNQSTSVCGTLSPAEICRFKLPWSKDNQTNIVSIQGEVVKKP